MDWDRGIYQNIYEILRYSPSFADKVRGSNNPGVGWLIQIKRNLLYYLHPNLLKEVWHYIIHKKNDE